MNYLVAHWRGELAPGKSLWINMFGVMLVLSWMELLWLSRLKSHPESLLSVTLISLLCSRVVVYSWQLTGLMRSIERDYMEVRDILKTRLLQGSALLTVLFTLVYALEVIQGATFYRSQLEAASLRPASPGYRIELATEGRLMTVTGPLEPGITSAVSSALAGQPEIMAVVLSSRGGQIYEGRGLARLFAQHRLDTYVFDECSSACTTAFIGGEQRYLGVQGKLGFHRYRLERSGFERIVPFYDLGAEQERDLALFRQRGVAPDFLEAMFARPPNELWYPDTDTLLAAGVVDRIVAAPL